MLRGGKGRARLVIMPVRDAPEWDSWHRPRRRKRPDPKLGAVAAMLEAELARERKQRIREREEYRQRLAQYSQKYTQLSASFKS